MRLLKLSILFLVLALLGMPAAVAADDEASAQCTFAPVIVEAADLVLEETKDVPRFWRDRLGSDAAYLKILYADIGYDEARALLRSLGEREKAPDRIVELRLAHASASDRAADVAVLRRAWPDRVPILLGPSGLRATVEQNGPDWLVDEVLLWHDKRFGLQSTAVEQLPDALAGIDEAKITRLAERFERAGEWRRAVDLLSIKADLSDAMALIEEYASLPHKPSLIARLVNMSAVRPAFEPSMQPAEVRAAISSSPWLWVARLISLAAAKMPEADILNRLLFNTGEARLGTWIAQGLLTDFQDGRLDPDAEPEVAVVVMVDGLDRIFGMEKRVKLLAAMPFVQRSHGASKLTAREFTDISIARAKLADYLQGGGDIPPRPGMLSDPFDWERTDGFDWERAQHVAAALTESAAIDDENRPLAAMLLTSAGRPAEALEELRLAGDHQQARTVAHELMLRLDRQCSKHYGHPVPFLPGLYRFE